MSLLGNSICQAVRHTYDLLHVKSGKPLVYDGASETTVLASIVAIMECGEIRPVCITTGLKAMPETARKYSHGRIVHDLHAEVLAVRALNRVLIGECRNANLGLDSWLVQKTGSAFEVRPSVQLALFVLEAPCGDASMAQLAQHSQPWKKRKIHEDVVRGRNNFDMVGVVRTKPGRADSPMTLSKLCSDKLCVRQLLGVTNCVTFQLFPQNVFLEYLVLPSDTFLEPDLKRCFRDRFRVEGARYMKMLPYEPAEFAFRLSSGARTSPLSLVHLVPTLETQVLSHGVRNGAHRKSSAPAPGGESMLCKKLLFEFGLGLVATDKNNYIDFKTSVRRRVHLKDTATMALGTWRRTGPDNFYYATYSESDAEASSSSSS